MGKGRVRVYRPFFICTRFFKKNNFKFGNFRHEKITEKKTILLTDDEDMILDIGENAMRRWGYNVISANSGSKALKIYEKERDRIDLVMLDMILGDIGGHEVYKQLRKIK